MLKYLLVFALTLNFTFAQDGKMVITPIHTIQGNGIASPMQGTVVVINGIVTGDFRGENKLNGFFVQEMQEDEDENTSEGIFVYDPAKLFAGNIGDYVQVIGEVGENRGKTSSSTQIKNVKSVFVISEKNKLPEAKLVTLPNDNWERFEGMRLKVKAEKGELFVTEMYQLGRFGQLTLCSAEPENQSGTDGRLDQFTQFNSANKEAYNQYLNNIFKRKIILDDGSGIRNPTVVPFGREGKPFSAFHAIRGGDTAEELVGILDDRFDAIRIQPTEIVYFEPKNKRAESSPELPRKTNLKVAAFNVLNFFNGDGLGGGFPTERGATNSDELRRQQTKILSALKGLDADVYSLMEIENDGFGANSAIQTLLNELNKITKRNYTFCEVENRGTDVITSSIIYDPKKVGLLGSAVSIPDGYGTASFDSSKRKPIVQTFKHLKTGEQFTLVAVHLKSKGVQSVGKENEDQNDGQGRNNMLRIRQANDLHQWLMNSPTGNSSLDYLILGDFNAYALEDPMLQFDYYGYKNLFPTTSYSYVYDGFWGSLDHALATESLGEKVTKAVKWHINADEAMVLDYNTEFKTDTQKINYFEADPFRSSDHDPLLIGFKFKKAKD